MASPTWREWGDGAVLSSPRRVAFRIRTTRSLTLTPPLLCAADASAESRVEYPEPIYVSRDEEFEEGKNEMLSEGAIKALLHNFMPLLVSSVSPDIRDFAGFHDVDNLFKEGLRLKQALHDQLFQKIPFVRKIQENSEGLLRYDTPDIIKSKPRTATLSVIGCSSMPPPWRRYG
jgi:lipoxygenase